MDINTTGAVIKNDFTGVYEQFQKYLKSRPYKSSDFMFFFSVAEKIQACSFNDLVTRKNPLDKTCDNVEDELKRRMNNLIICVKATHKRYYFTSDIIEKMPQQVEDFYRKMIQENFDKREKYAKMDTQKQHEEIMESINELKKSDGFFMVGQDENGFTLKSGDDITEDDIRRIE